MNVYVVVINDVHSGVDTEVFGRAAEAEGRAQEILGEHLSRVLKDEINVYLSDDMLKDNWIFFGEYDRGESYVAVMQREVK